MVTRRHFIGASALVALAVGVAAVHAEDARLQLFDTHAHFYTDDLAAYPLSDQGNADVSAATVRARVLANPTTLNKVLSWWDAAGVEGGAGVQYRTAYGLDNRYLLDSADRAGTRIAPVIVIDATDPSAPETIRRLARTRGLAGIRMTGFQIDGEFPWLDSPAAQRTWAAAEELGLAVVVMYLPPRIDQAGSAAALGRIGALAAKYPNAAIVLDHLGWPAPEGAPDFGLTPAHTALRARPNVYMKFTSASIERLHAAKQSPADFLRHSVDVFGADHVMWGSDVGNSAGSYTDLVQEVLSAAARLSPAEKRAVLHDTGKAVFVRGGRGALRQQRVG